MRCNARQFLAWLLLLFVRLLRLVIESCLNQLEPRIHDECGWCLTVSENKIVYLDLLLVQWLLGIGGFAATYDVSYVPSLKFLIQRYHQ